MPRPIRLAILLATLLSVPVYAQTGGQGSGAQGSGAQGSGAQQSPGGQASGAGGGGAQASGPPAGPAMAAAPPAGTDFGERRVLTLGGAQKVLAAAEDAARKSQAPSSIAIVDEAGDLVAFAQMDGARPAGITIAIGKARSAARFRQPTEALENAINGGRQAAISAGVTEMQGGVPIASGGAVIGAIGVSGLNKDNDVKIAQQAAGAVE
jgi:glc operon protein GlcG